MSLCSLLKKFTIWVVLSLSIVVMGAPKAFPKQQARLISSIPAVPNNLTSINENNNNSKISTQAPPISTELKKTGPATTPISSGTVVGMFAVYPKVNYGTGDKAELIKHGEYLVKVGDCIACHTDTLHHGASFSGGLAMKTPFGTFYSPNITPDLETGLGKWSVDDFIRAMQQGKNPKGHNYFPVFPYIYFTKTSKDDLRAMFAYLQAIPPVKKQNKKLPFPFSVPGSRFALYGWNLLFFYANQGEYQYDATKSAEWNRGAYLVEGLGHCGMCHTPLNVFGAPKTNYFLTGAFIDNYWAPNITGFGLKSASRGEIANVFVTGQLINQAGPVAGPMADVNHDSLQYLTENDRLAIAHYLKTVVSRQPLGLEPVQQLPTLKRGKQVYFKACDTCHKKGQVGAPVIGDGNNWYRRTQEVGINTLYRHAINGFNSMPVRGGCVTCSDNDIISAVDYILAASLNHTQRQAIQKGAVQQTKVNGKEVYDENCSTCHAEGKLGAPKLSDKSAWMPLLNQDFDNVVTNTINGPNHPKNGGCRYCSSSEVIAAIKYMFTQINPQGNYSLW